MRLADSRAGTDALVVSPVTVKRGWSMARAWLHREMGRILENGDSGGAL